ncbi:MAG: hypothetical protein JWN72_1289 [Thermoleophilia bacterium]|nr:hypothetical protein [Thermoleophilia bacterium]
MATDTQDAGSTTGTADATYDIIWFVEQCLHNALKMDQCIEDAEANGDVELAEFFGRAQRASRRGAEQGKELMVSRLTS